jgi:hypothetical protein
MWPREMTKNYSNIKTKFRFFVLCESLQWEGWDLIPHKYQYVRSMRDKKKKCLFTRHEKEVFHLSMFFFFIKIYENIF